MREVTEAPQKLLPTWNLAQKTQVLGLWRPQLCQNKNLVPGRMGTTSPAWSVMGWVPLSCHCPLLPSAIGFSMLGCKLDQPGKFGPFTPQLQG